MNNSWTDFYLLIRLILDILFVWALIYAGIRIVRNNSRTIQIVKGILVLFMVKMLAMVLNLSAASYVMDIFLNWSVILVLIVLQPEIRGMLEKVGKTNPLFASGIPSEKVNHMIDELVTAVEDMSKNKTGALISLQMGQSMQDYVDTGVQMQSDVSSELLETIFQYGTPMHDGAVIIQGDKVACAAAYLPSTSKDLPSKYGARHRAAVGISEVTDSITIIVSEETGNISVANRGVLTQYNAQALHRFLSNKLATETSAQPANMFSPVINSMSELTSSLNRSNRTRNSGKRNDDRVKAIEIVDLSDVRKEED